MEQFVTVTPDQLTQLLSLDWKIWQEKGPEYGRAPCIRGYHGIGKTEVVEQFAKDVFEEIWILTLIHADPTDFRGFMFLSEGKVIRVPPDFEPPDDGKKRIIFFDDVITAPPSVQASLFRILKASEGDKGNYMKRWGRNNFIVLACNYRKEGAGFPMPDQVVNRVNFYDLQANADDWCLYAMTKGISPVIVGYVKKNPDALVKLPPPGMHESMPHPTPRAWFAADAFLKEAPEDLLMFGLAGRIGVGATTELLAFRRLEKDLPDIDKILKGEDIIPEKDDVLYLTIMSLLSRISQKKTKSLWNRVLEYSLVLPQRNVSLTTFCGASMLKMDAGIVAFLPIFDQWADKVKFVMPKKGE